MPDFVPDDNGLFEIKLIQTQEGLVFINFASEAINLPFAGVKSNFEVGDLHLRDSFTLTTELNWKDIGT